MTELICIVCPKGCRLKVDESDNFKVSGNDCIRGEGYAKKELTNPTRTITSIARIRNADYPCCPVKTSGEIPKEQIMDAMELLKPVVLRAPVTIGDIVVENICGSGVHWIATRNMKREK